jgi:uncharacterized membrane protein YdjX (TVP38/TMEM64 family)
VRRILPFLLVAFVVLAFVGGRLVRAEMELELSPESIRVFVAGYGWVGPLVFLLALTFRNFLLLPSMVILPAGGLVFGALAGTLLGTAGIALSGLIKFAIARGVVRDTLRDRFGAAMRGVERRIEAAGPLVVGAVTAHPAGPMSAFHWGAGFSSIALLPFCIALGAGGLVRAGAYSIFGATLLEPGTPRFYLASALLAALALAPLVHPGLRRRVLGRSDGEPREEREGSAR